MFSNYYENEKNCENNQLETAELFFKTSYILYV